MTSVSLGQVIFDMKYSIGSSHGFIREDIDLQFLRAFNQNPGQPGVPVS